MAFLGGFFGIKLLTNIMSLESYGQLALGLTIVGLISMFLYGPIANSILRFYSISKEQNNLSAFYHAVKKIHLKYAGIFLLIGLAVLILSSNFTNGEWSVFLFFTLLFAILNGINDSLTSLNSASRQRKVVALHQAADLWMRPIFAGLFVYIFIDTGYLAILGFFLASLTAGLSRLYFFIRSAKVDLGNSQDLSPEIKKKSFDSLNSYAKSFSVIAIFGAVVVYSDKWMILEVISAKEVGIYAAIYQIASAPIIMLTGVVSQLMVPIIFEKAGSMNSVFQIQRSRKILFNTAIVFSILIFIAVLLAFYFGHQIICLLTTAQIAQYSQILWILVASIGLSALADLLAVSGFKKNIPQAYIPAKAIQAVFFLILGYLSVKSYGVIGIAVAGLSASFIFIVLVIFVNMRIAKMY